MTVVRGEAISVSAMTVVRGEAISVSAMTVVRGEAISVSDAGPERAAEIRARLTTSGVGATFTEGGGTSGGARPWVGS